MSATMVKELILEIERYCRTTHGTLQVIPKIGKIRKTGNYKIDNLNFVVEDTYSYKGKAYSCVYEWLGRRTIFLKKPVVINGEKYYLEIKGYGANGKCIYPREHDEYDIYYGMYYKYAEKEFDNLEIANRLGIKAPLPIALVEMNPEELTKQLFLGLKELLISYLRFKNIDYKLWADFLKKCGYKGKISEDDIYKPKNCQLEKAVIALRKIYEQDGADKLHKTLNYLVSGDAMINLRPINFVRFDSRAGYVVRACRSPLRVGDPNDRKIDVEQYKEIAKTIGKNFRLLLENGYLHSSPSIGNWTIAGEITDFADVIDLRTGQLELLRVMESFSTPTLDKYVQFILGFPHSGALSPYFCEGTMGRKTSFEEACDGVLSILREFV